MNVYNSAGGLNQDDTDMTMINHSFIYGGNDESINSCIPIVRRQQANQSKSINNPSNSDDRNDYIEVNIRQIEQILNFYRQDLKQESKTQLDCNRQLITRLIDFLRPAYSSDENQMKNLDILYKEIFDLQDIRFIEQKEKNDQLSIQIRYLKKSIITTPIKDDDRDSLMTNVYQMNTMIDYEQWLEVEEETKQLHQLVKTQREHIDQLVEILSLIDEEKMIHQRTTIPSLEISIEEKPDSLPELPVYATKECSVYNDESSDIQINDHVENCLSTSNIVDTPVPTEPERLGCPFCDEKFTNNDDIAYIEHLSRCFNDMNGHF